jgi:hypothetical protein
MVSLTTLRPIKADQPAQTGDALKRMLIVEYTLTVNNEAAQGGYSILRKKYLLPGVNGMWYLWAWRNHMPKCKDLIVKILPEIRGVCESTTNDSRSMGPKVSNTVMPLQKEVLALRGSRAEIPMLAMARD